MYWKKTGFATRYIEYHLFVARKDCFAEARRALFGCAGNHSLALEVLGQGFRHVVGERWDKGGAGAVQVLLYRKRHTVSQTLLNENTRECRRESNGHCRLFLIRDLSCEQKVEQTNDCKSNRDVLCNHKHQVLNNCKHDTCSTREPTSTETGSLMSSCLYTTSSPSLRRVSTALSPLPGSRDVSTHKLSGPACAIFLAIARPTPATVNAINGVLAQCGARYSVQSFYTGYSPHYTGTPHLKASFLVWYPTCDRRPRLQRIANPPCENATEQTHQPPRWETQLSDTRCSLVGSERLN